MHSQNELGAGDQAHEVTMRVMSVLFPMALLGCGLDQLTDDAATTLDNEISRWWFGPATPLSILVLSPPATQNITI